MLPEVQEKKGDRLLVGYRPEKIPHCMNSVVLRGAFSGHVLGYHSSSWWSTVYSCGQTDRDSVTSSKIKILRAW